MLLCSGTKKIKAVFKQKLTRQDAASIVEPALLDKLPVFIVPMALGLSSPGGQRLEVFEI